MRRFSCGGRLRAVAMMLLLLVPGMAAFSTANLAVPSVAQAQDDASGEDAEVESDDAAKQRESQKNLLGWFLEALGWDYTISFLAISFWFVALLVMCTLMLRRDSICPPQLAELMEAHLNEKRYQEAFDLAKSDDSFLGMVLAAGMAKLQNGYSKVVEAMRTSAPTKG
jgi:biopolymer transport protein ExbB